MMGDFGRGLRQRTIEELVKSESGLGRGPGYEPEPPPRSRTWYGAFGLLVLIGAAIVLVLVDDCADLGDPATASPSPALSAAAPPFASRSLLEG